MARPAGKRWQWRWISWWRNNANGDGKSLAYLPVQQGSNTIYYIQIAGQNVIFEANLSLSPKLPLVQAGDTITGSYLNAGGETVQFQSFDDLSINLSGNGTPTAGGSPTPSPSPGATATP